MKKNKKYTPDLIIPELYDIGRKGLKKLVPSDKYGWPAFNKHGIPNSRHSEYYEEGIQEYLFVELSNFISNYKWMCVLNILDGDDFIMSKWMDLTLENWKKQVDTYNSITQIDDNMVDYLLEMEDFKLSVKLNNALAILHLCN